jgi:hypothetical protein
MIVECLELSVVAYAIHCPLRWISRVRQVFEVVAEMAVP